MLGTGQDGVVGPCGRVGSCCEGGLRRERRGWFSPASFCWPERGLSRSQACRGPVSVSFLLCHPPASGSPPSYMFFPSFRFWGDQVGNAPI